MTWGNESNINNNFFYDKYFDQKSNLDQNILWVVIYSGNQKIIKDIKFDNVIFIIEEKIFFIRRI